MDLAPFLQALAKTENIAVLVLMIVCAFLCRVIVTIRTEDRSDREKQEQRANQAQERNNLILEKLAEAITQMRITLASKGQQNDRL